ncbi:hypothetical protein EI94DRAFT_1791620 [Lactarius quietus]|nr:hypothetical protein EI94DRAFT_1791620 [Lactarius quietus]
MLTRSAARALLINRITINELSEDVLLEIFDAHRKLYELEPRYETVWNSRDGWFKLTHVCRSWRRLVHMSPSRLHVHLLFTPLRSSRVKMLKNLPPFPILVDYSIENWTDRERSLAVAAIRHRSSRVRAITIHKRLYADIAKVLMAMSQPFPELEILKICSRYDSYDHYSELILPAKFLSGSAPYLRRLTLQDIVPRCLPSLLSFVATGLVELILGLRVSESTLPEASFIANLQRMSCLRRLELSLKYPFLPPISDNPGPPTGARNIALPNLMEFNFVGHINYVESLAVVLASPHLQRLNVAIGDTSDAFPIPHLCRFICDTNKQFILVRFHLSAFEVTFTGETSKSAHAQSFRIILPEPMPLEELCNRLPGPLTTVEELVVEWDLFAGTRRVEWRQIFEHIRQVKFIEVPSQVALNVAHALQLDGQETAMDLLPALEQVKVQMVYFPPPISDSNTPYLTISDAFEPLIAARKKVGRPITLSSTRVDNYFNF